MADELPGRVQSGVSVGQFGTWMSAEQRRVFLLCRRLLQDEGEADSLTQEVFLKAYRSLEKDPAPLDDAEGSHRWITRIAVNACLDRLRSKAWKIWQRRPAPDDEATILQMKSAGGPDAESLVFARQIQQRLERALVKLSAQQRAVFSLRHYEGLELSDIAGVLKLEVGTVKVHLFRAMNKLREELKDLYSPSREPVRRQA